MEDEKFQADDYHDKVHDTTNDKPEEHKTSVQLNFQVTIETDRQKSPKLEYSDNSKSNETKLFV